MTQINAIYTTVSGGQVHIAADTKYIGSVDSYNNCLTQFFAWVFRLSIAVDFDGKVRSVNKEDYTRLVQSLTKEAEISDIYQRSVFRPVAEKATLPTGNRKMRDVITSEDRNALFQKLAIAISKGDTTKALSMIGKGAEVDTAYYDREKLSPSFDNDTSMLDPHSRYGFSVFHAAPILQAALKGNSAVCRFLEEAGASRSARGKAYNFTREITKVNKHLEFGAEPQLVPHHHHSKDPDGHDRDTVSHKVEYQPKLRERTTVSTLDSRSPSRFYQLNGANRLVELY